MATFAESIHPIRENKATKHLTKYITKSDIIAITTMSVQMIKPEHYKLLWFFYLEDRVRRQKTFTFRVHEGDNKMIALLAEYYRRSRSDVIRMLIHDATKSISKASKTMKGKIHSPTNEEIIL